MAGVGDFVTISNVLPDYFLDYRECLADGTHWTDRVAARSRSSFASMSFPSAISSLIQCVYYIINPFPLGRFAELAGS